MTDLLAARLQMAFSLGFHIVFASIGMAMPFLMITAYRKYIRTQDNDFLLLTKAWSKGVAIFFAVGAVSGTALSFELGLLWPGFMKHAGPIVGLPFSLEGAAFFVEAIALGIFLYGWDRAPRSVHWASGLVVGLSGLASAFFVIAANGWMNAPAGFDWNNGNPINIDPIAAMFNEALWLESLHMVVAAFEAVGFAVGGVHAFLFLKHRHVLHKKALRIALFFGAAAALVQPVIGDFAAKDVAKRQPEKLAAMEAHFKTGPRAPLLIGGIPNEETGEIDFGFKIPGLLSFLIHGDTNAVVQGLDSFPREEWPPVLVTHVAFQIMVGLGMFLAALALLVFLAEWRKPFWFEERWFLNLMVLSVPLGFIAMEAGWVVTEVGRQPWIIYKVLKTADSLTPRPGILLTLITYAILYGFLTAVLVAILKRQFNKLERELRL